MTMRRRRPATGMVQHPIKTDLAGVRSDENPGQVSEGLLCSHGRPRSECSEDRKREAGAFAKRWLDGMLEREFQSSVRETLESLGFVVWVFPQMKYTVAGVPDLTFWHPRQPGVLHCWELKKEKGRIRPAQVAALAHLETVPGIDARLVRPSDWEALRDALVSDLIEPVEADR